MKHFPTAGGKLENFQSIRCTPEDSVSISFADADMTMEKWLSVRRGHHHPSHGHHPSLLPIFDPLFHRDQNDTFDKLLTAKVTRFASNSGTAVALNANHVLGDTASCVRLAECWGLANQKRQFRVPCLNRAALSCTGMMDENIVDLLGIDLGNSFKDKDGSMKKSTASSSWWSGFFFDSSPNEKEPDDEKSMIDHEYVSLPFSAEVLDAMKAHGMKSCKITKRNESAPPFISRNDAIMATTWVIKRLLSRDNDSHLSIVMNLRGRCGITNFYGKDKEGIEKNEDASSNEGRKSGLFGNGIVNVFAKVKTSSLMERNERIGLSNVSEASKAIRMALIQGEGEIPDRLIQSKLGMPISSSTTKPPSSPTATSSYFSTTSWRQLSPRDVTFSPSSTLVSFHGQPAHPLPIGRTYTSVVHEDIDNKGGSSVDLFLPSDQQQKAMLLHEEICDQFLVWFQEMSNEKQTIESDQV